MFMKCVPSNLLPGFSAELFATHNYWNDGVSRSSYTSFFSGNGNSVIYMYTVEVLLTSINMIYIVKHLFHICLVEVLSLTPSTTKKVSVQSQ